MTESQSEIDGSLLEKVNEKDIKNQFFTPDHVYVDLSLLKDIPIGIIYTDLMINQDNEIIFQEKQKFILEKLKNYQNRTYETIDPYFSEIGYTDQVIDTWLHDKTYHDLIFTLSPNTYFLEMLLRHLYLNQNHSRPANKYQKKYLDKQTYVLESLQITYYINIFPLNLSHNLLTNLAKELGESLGVNIKFINKDPSLFDLSDWNEWLSKIECFYLNSLGRFTRSSFIIEKQEALQFLGCYLFARKRFETSVMDKMKQVDFNHQIQLVTAQLDMLCHFEWIQNNDVRLTQERDDVPFEIYDKDILAEYFKRNG